MDVRVQNKNLKTIRCFLWSEATLNEQTKQVIQSRGLQVGTEPLVNFANLNLLKASILSFWCLKKTKLKGCHCVKSVLVQGYSGPYFPTFRSE